MRLNLARLRDNRLVTIHSDRRNASERRPVLILAGCKMEAKVVPEVLPEKKVKKDESGFLA